MHRKSLLSTIRRGRRPRSHPVIRQESPDSYDPEDTYIQDIAFDVALEIGLRERLLETAKSRIAWALLLKEPLTNETSAVLQTLPQTLSFKEAALDALAAIEAPSEILFVRDEPIPPLDTRRQSVTAKLRKKATSRAQPPKKGGKFLYIRLKGSTAPSILRCPNCLRTEFSSLQGLFKHARSTHSLAWTSHDECVRQCGGAVDFADLDAEVEVGAGTGGVLPGLRNLFERAVGEDDTYGLDGETALSQTLGFHVDTPALASFLGREPIRRGVTVWDPDVVVDIDGFGADEKPRAKPRWRMPFTHRNVFTELPQGEEQILDVELDRGTLFFPLRSGYMPVGTRALWDMAPEPQRHTPVENAAAVTGPVAGNPRTSERRGTLFRRSRFWEVYVKGGKPPSPALPYKLAANPSQFSALVMGRKKAIEVCLDIPPFGRIVTTTAVGPCHGYARRIQRRSAYRID
ncbi:hypothetical protein B0H10DRAFT_1950373 [Mycena sp. CBHHK59/15]|nr:hypothetical protein B0H10DRAFT_1950373 [Mycena sp. CBHHK59/15]